MSTSRTRSSRRLVAVVAVAVLAAVVTGSPASAADGPGAAQDAYVASLLAAHDADRPYTQMDDYVRTLVFWHAHPDWVAGS